MDRPLAPSLNISQANTLGIKAWGPFNSIITLISNYPMMAVPKSHPRYESLKKRELIIEGVRDGLVAEAGLIAHGRGEAFDYLMGEKTLPSAQKASLAAAALLLSAKHPVISVNGNTAVLAAEDLVKLSKLAEAPLEINLFYRTEERIAGLTKYLEERGAKNVLGADPGKQIPGIDHARSLCCDEGIFSADVILVPLEDGDRAKALVDMGKKTIVIDINPMSRSSKTATITLADELTRAIPLLMQNMEKLKGMGGSDLQKILADFDNLANLKETEREISENLSALV